MNQKGLIGLVTMGVIVVIVAAIGYFFATQETGPEATLPIATRISIPAATPTPSPTPAPTPDPTADWKRYENKKYNYEIKYPANWYIDIENSEKDFTKRGEKNNASYIGGDTAWSNYPGFSYRTGKIPENYELVSLMVFKVDAAKTVDDFVKEKKYEKFVSERYYAGGDPVVGYRSVVNIFKDGERMYVFSTAWESKDIYKKIISTFKFTPKGGAPSLSAEELAVKDWKIYQDFKYGFEIKYPANVEKYSRDWGADFAEKSLTENTFFSLHVYSDLKDLPNNAKGLSFDDWLSEQLKNKIFQNKKDFTLGVLAGFEIVDRGIIDFRNILAEKDGFIYSFSIKENTKSMALFEQMLSTFKFIEKDATLDWKTYTNNKYGFSVRYPKGWVASGEDISGFAAQALKNQAVEDLHQSKFSDPKNPERSFSIIVYNNGNNYVLEPWLVKYKQSNPIGSGLSFGIVSNPENKDILIDGSKGLKGDFGCCATYKHAVFLRKNNRIYQISGGFLDLNTHAYPYEDVYIQFLSTFNFTE